MYRRKRFLGAFTVVELLVVIVVIAILAALVVVSFNGISRRAYDASVAQALAQTKRATIVYSQTDSIKPNEQSLYAGSTTMRQLLISGNYLASAYDQGLKSFGPSNTISSSPVVTRYCGNNEYFIFAASFSGTAASQWATEMIACDQQLATSLGYVYSGGYAFSSGTYYQMMRFQSY